LEYQYALGSESDITYRRNPDTNKRVQDNSIILSPQINGYITYRPTNWLEMTLEMILEREIAAQEEKRLVLPSGDTRIAERRRTSFLIDQAFVTFKQSPFELSVGRKNFEDDRHWIYDTSLDVILAKFSQGAFQAEASLSRKDKWDLDLGKNVVPGRIDNYMLYMTYRGFEDVKLNGYVVKRHDRARIETDGKPKIMGVSVLGNPTNEFSYWAEHAYVRGRDENRQRLSGYAYDVGGTYRFTGVPLRPNMTLGVAFGSGDGNPTDNTNHEFRQTGLQSNEARYAGVSKFKTYGEVLDPELSNLNIYTAALGFQPAPGITADLVFHRYRLDRLVLNSDIRNSPITAQVNDTDVAGRVSKDIGKEVDIVLGFRQLFGIRRLGLDLRMGVLFPGKAFLRNDGNARNPILRNGDKSYALVAKFWYSF
jgi:alginate production protein